MLPLSLFQFSWIIIFFAIMIIATSYDRDGLPSVKWIFLAIGFGVLIFWVWLVKDHEFIFNFVMSKTFFVGLVIYIVLGILYSGVELFITVRKIAEDFKAYWRNFLTSYINVCIYDDDGKIDNKERQEQYHRMTVAELLKHPQLKIDNHPIRLKASEELKHWVACFSSSYSDIVRIRRVSKDTVEGKLIEPYIEKKIFAESVGSWIFLWPFYAGSLFFSKFLVHLVSVVGSWFVKIGKKIVDKLFDDTFTAKS